MFKHLVLSALLICVALSQQTTQAPPPAAAAPAPGPVGGSVGVQQALLGATAHVFLEWQSANAWATVLTCLNRLQNPDLLSEDPAAGANSMFPPAGFSLDADNDNDGFLGLGKEDREELKSEEALSLALKIMWLQSAKRLDTAQQKHYQNQMAIGMIQQSGIGQSQQLSYLLMLMYYRSVLDSMGSMASIVRQDAWTHWNHHEMIETYEFKGEEGQPGQFQEIMERLNANAMHSWNTEVTIEIQGMFVDMYLANIVGQLTGQPTGSSFLEVEEEAQPTEAQPTEQSSVGGPQMAAYWSTMLSAMNMYSKFMEYSAAHSYSTVAYLETSDQAFENKDEYVEYLKKSGISSWTQWAHIRQLLAYYNIFFLWYGTGGFGSMGGAGGGSLGAALGGSMGGPAGSMLGGSLGAGLGNGAVVGSALGGSLGGPYGSLLGGSLGSSLGFVQTDAESKPETN